MSRTLLDWLVDRYPNAKKQTLKRMAAAGRVRVNGKPVAVLKTALEENDQVVVTDQSGDAGPRDEASGPGSRQRTGLAARAPKPRNALRIVFEDEDILVVDKPAGLLTSTVPTEKRPTLLAAVREHVAKTAPAARVGLIHRLDRDASGLLVFSKNDDAYRSLKSQFFHHSVERIYSAVVHHAPNPRSGEIESWLVERADGTVYSTGEHGKGERALTKYETVQAGKRSAMVRVTLQTGRKHQIRVHLRERGCPIVGDRMYLKDPVKPNDAKSDRLCLSATSLSLNHPRSGERVTFTLPVPDAFALAMGIEPASAEGQAASADVTKSPTSGS